MFSECTGDSVGTARQLRFINITGKSENGGLLSSLQAGGLKDVLFENVHIKIATWSNYSRGSHDGKAGPVGPVRVYAFCLSRAINWLVMPARLLYCLNI